MKPFTRKEIKELPLGFTPSGNGANRSQRRKMMKKYAELLKRGKS